jgi:hypothetical protein
MWRNLPFSGFSPSAWEFFHLGRSTIRDKIIPHAVSWFTGEALQGEDFEDEDEEGNEDDEDEDDEEEAEEDEEEDEEDDDEEEVHGQKVTCLFLFSYCECWIVYSIA